MDSTLLQPPVPYSDFQFSFDPQLSNLFPQPPQLPPSAELFSQSETDDLFNFLDVFEDSIWGAEPESAEHNSFDRVAGANHLTPHAPYSNPHLNTVPDPNPASSSRKKRNTRSSAARATRSMSKASSSSHTSSSTTPPAQYTHLDNNDSIPSSESLSPTLTSRHETDDSSSTPKASSGARQKPLLSSPQKRLNHIMSEQKRRNAIRDGYAQLITLLAPTGNGPGIGMPTRGRPKGSGTRGKGGKKAAKDAEGAKGKSGVLFRAVEYCRWLEEGRDALRREVAKVEAAAGAMSL